MRIAADLRACEAPDHTWALGDRPDESSGRSHGEPPIFLIDVFATGTLFIVRQ